jgi:hypothetical protein
VVQEGQELAQTTAATPDPVNEPCYSSSSCRAYGDASQSGFICCVTIGTCDNLVSNTQRYYQGGCRGVNYRRDASQTASTSTSTDFPATDEGCVKQGECNVPFLEQDRGWTVRGAATLSMTELPPSVYEAFLVGATESTPGACRDPYFAASGDDVLQVAMEVVSSVPASSFTAAVITQMESSVANQLNVAPVNVDIVAVATARLRRSLQSGGTTITVTVTYSSTAAANDAVAAASASGGFMSSPSSATSFLSVPGLAVTVSSISNTGSTQQPPSDDGLSTAALVGIIVGSVVGVLVIAGCAVLMMRKGKSQGVKGAATPGSATA